MSRGKGGGSLGAAAARLLAVGIAFAALPALAQNRPSEDELFGGSSAAPDAGTPAAPLGTTTGSAAASGSAGASGSAASDGQNRPSEDELFGGNSAQKPVPETPNQQSTAGALPPKTEPPNGGETENQQEAEGLKGGAKNKFETGEANPDNPLKIGGQIYSRMYANWSEGTPFSQTRFSAPTLVDAYFDGRPSDRLRGMIVARMSYDPTIGATQPTLIPGVQTAAPPNPSIGLDQLWLRFDIARVVFVTAGRQHIRWGTGRVWAPTDFLTPQRRDPLAPFDARLGASMLKLHIPWEEHNWNFYAIGMFDSAFANAQTTTDTSSGSNGIGANANTPSVTTTSFDSTNILGSLGAAFRAEVLLGNTEFGIDAVLQRGRNARFGLDASAPVGPFDVYIDVAEYQGFNQPLIRFTGGTYNPSVPYAAQTELIAADAQHNWTTQAVAGVSTTIVYNDNDTLILGGEYFFNSRGYSDPNLYPWLMVNGAYTPFYLGRHYGALTATLAAPGNWDNSTFTFSTIGNLSDLSFVSRLDFFQRVLSYLQVEAFAAAHYGRRNGEFRQGFTIPATTPPQTLPGGQVIPTTVSSQPASIDMGLGLRLSI